MDLNETQQSPAHDDPAPEQGRQPWDDALDPMEKIERLREATLALAKSLSNQANTADTVDLLS